MHAAARAITRFVITAIGVVVVLCVLTHDGSAQIAHGAAGTGVPVGSVVTSATDTTAEVVGDPVVEGAVAADAGATGAGPLLAATGPTPLNPESIGGPGAPPESAADEPAVGDAHVTTVASLVEPATENIALEAEPIVESDEPVPDVVVHPSDASTELVVPSPDPVAEIPSAQGLSVDSTVPGPGTSNTTWTAAPVADAVSGSAPAQKLLLDAVQLDTGLLAGLTGTGGQRTTPTAHSAQAIVPTNGQDQPSLADAPVVEDVASLGDGLQSALRGKQTEQQALVDPSVLSELDFQPVTPNPGSVVEPGTPALEPDALFVEIALEPVVPVAEAATVPVAPLVERAVEPIVPVLQIPAEPIAPFNAHVTPIIETVVEPVVESFTDPVMPIVNAVVEPILPVMNQIADPVPLVDSVIAPVVPMVTTVADPVAPVIDSVIQPVEPLVGVAIEPVSPIVDLGLEPVGLVVEPVGSTGGTVVELVRSVFEPVASILEPIPPVVEPVLPIVDPVAKAIEPVIDTVVEPVSSTVASMHAIIEPILPVFPTLDIIVKPPSFMAEPVVPVVDTIVMPDSPVVGPALPVIEPVASAVSPGDSVLPVIERISPKIMLALPTVEPTTGRGASVSQPGVTSEPVATVAQAAPSAQSARPVPSYVAEYAVPGEASTDQMCAVDPAALALVLGLSGLDALLDADSPAPLHSPLDAATSLLASVVADAVSLGTSASFDSAPVAILMLLGITLLAGRRAFADYQLRVPSTIYQTVPVPPG